MRRSLTLLVLFLGNVFSLLATTVTYAVSVNTSSLAGVTGSVDFNFDPGGLISEEAEAQILGFGGNGRIVGPVSQSGDVTGALPGTVTFDNQTSFNDDFQDFTFGSSLNFIIGLSGPALSAPNGTSSSGSTFAFSAFSDAAGTLPAFTSDTAEGFAYLVNINLDGSTTVTNYILNPPSTVPEPATWPLIGLSAICLVVQLAWKKRKETYAAEPNTPVQGASISITSSNRITGR